MTAKKTAVDLTNVPTRATWGGYVYILRFSSGTIKVGSTTAPQSRIKSHQMAGMPFGVDLTHVWVSSQIEGHAAVERQLLGVAASLAERVTAREWFHGVDYDLLVRHAGGLAGSATSGVKTPKRLPPMVDLRVFREAIGVTIDELVERINAQGFVTVTASEIGEAEAGRLRASALLVDAWARALRANPARIWQGPELRALVEAAS